MAIKFKKDEAVRQIVPAPLEGVVIQTAIIDNEVRYLVQMPDESQRWFREEEIETG